MKRIIWVILAIVATIFLVGLIVSPTEAVSGWPGYLAVVGAYALFAMDMWEKVFPWLRGHD